jgi:hypothetical protein
MIADPRGAVCNICGQPGDPRAMVGVGVLAVPVHVGPCFDRWLADQLFVVRRIMERAQRRQGKR